MPTTTHKASKEEIKSFPEFQPIDIQQDFDGIHRSAAPFLGPELQIAGDEGKEKACLGDEVSWCYSNPNDPEDCFAGFLISYREDIDAFLVADWRYPHDEELTEYFVVPSNMLAIVETEKKY